SRINFPLKCFKDSGDGALSQVASAGNSTARAPDWVLSDGVTGFVCWAKTPWEMKIKISRMRMSRLSLSQIYSKLAVVEYLGVNLLKIMTASMTILIASKMLNRYRSSLREINLLNPVFQKTNYFFIGFVPVSDVYKMFGQQVIPLTHEPDEHMKKMNALKNNRVVRDVLIECLFEKYRMFGPVHGRPLVVRNMVTIVPAFVVEF